MLQGAIIGIIVAIIVMIIQKNKQKKALAKLNGPDVLDRPEYSAYFHYATEKTFLKKGFKFFDNNGVLYMNGTNLSYEAHKATNTITFDLSQCNVSYAGLKRKMKWICIEQSGTKHYFTTFEQGAFKMDRSEMDRFIDKLKGLLPQSEL